MISANDGDTLPDIARHFGLGYNEITIANPGIGPWTPKAGARVLLPLQFILPDAPRKGIVLNLANMRMFYYPPKQPDTLFTYPVGIGREGWNTPLGQTTVVAKKVNPAWTVPESIRREHAAKGDPLPAVVPPGPDNPLGKYALLLGFNTLPDPRHQQALRRRHAGQPRLCAALPRRHRSAVQKNVGRDAGADRTPALYDGMGRGHALPGSP